LQSIHPYGVRDVEKLLRLPRSTIRSLVGAGFVSPARGPRNAWLFSFQDLIVMRAARTLAEAKVPAKRITRSMRELRRQLPEAMPLSGLAICAVGDRVAVREGAARWQADSGQYLLALEGDAAGAITVVEPPSSTPGTDSAAAFYEQAVAIEESDAQAAVKLYTEAVAADSRLADACINLGRLLHELGRLAEAERVYRDAIAAGIDDPLLHFNLGVLLEDRGRKEDALRAYEEALRTTPLFVDALHNAALLADELGRPREALRYMAQYRRLAGKSR
jgi:tetratricopeptide (TPR) repeat protein